MKKTLVAFTLLFLTLITNAQTLEGKWKFEKVKLCGILIYFDDTDKDKENLIKAYLENIESGMASDEEKSRWKKQTNDNKALIYASGKDQYKGTITFKGEFKEADGIYDGYGEGKLYFKYLNDDNKIELVESKIEIKDNILELFDKRLFENKRYEISLKGMKLVLTDYDESEIFDKPDEPLMIIYYEKKL